MPVKRRVAKLRRRALAPGLWEMLLDRPLPAGANRWAKHAFPQLREQLWRDYRDAVLEEFARRRPGRRPSSWWLLDAPGPRLVCWHGKGIESEASFLRRHGLLGEAEGARLRGRAFRPARIGKRGTHGR